MIGQRIYYFRKSNGMTQEQLAHGICSVSHLSKIENGHEQPSQDILEHLCKRLSISLDDIDSRKSEEEFSMLLNEWYSAILNRDIDRIQQLYRAAKAKKELLQDPKLLIKFQLVYIRYLILDHKDLAERELEKVKGYHKNFDQEMEYHYFVLLGMIEYTKLNFPDALDFYKKAEEIATEIRLESPELFYQLALIYSRLYYVSFSIHYINKALEIFNKQYNFRRCIECEIILGINNNKINHPVQAKKHYLNALKIAKTNRDQVNTAIIYHNLGVLYSDDNPLKANEYFFESLSLQGDNAYEQQVNTYYRLSSNYYKLNDLDKMNDYIEYGVSLSDQHNLTSWKLKFEVLKCKTKQYDEVTFQKIIKDQVLPYFMDKRLHHEVAEYSEILADLYYKQFKYKQASFYYRLANNSRKSMNIK